MKVTYTLILFLGFCTILVSAASRCKHDEVELYSNDSAKSYNCQKCISCPPGEGPSEHCGAEYLKGTKITCKTCINGISYSEDLSISSCQPCPLCEGKETLQTCTPWRKSICSTGCRVGFIMDHVVDQCVPDPSFSSSQQPNINTAKQTTTQMTEPTTIPKMTDGSTTSQVQETQRETHETPSAKHHHPTADNFGKNGLQPNKTSDDSKENKIILVVICILVIMVIVILGLMFLYKRCFQPDARNPDEEMPLANKNSTSPRTSQDIAISVPWSDSLRLQDIEGTLRFYITNQISTTSTAIKGWDIIGERLGLGQNQLQAVEVAGQKQQTNHGRELFTTLASVYPELTLSKFVEVLEELPRKDVVDFIKSHYNNKNKVNSVVQITEEHQNHDNV